VRKVQAKPRPCFLNTFLQFTVLLNTGRRSLSCNLNFALGSTNAQWEKCAQILVEAGKVLVLTRARTWTPFARQAPIQFSNV
jgi:hypothetical protein